MNDFVMHRAAKEGMRMTHNRTILDLAWGLLQQSFDFSRGPLDERVSGQKRHYIQFQNASILAKNKSRNKAIGAIGSSGTERIEVNEPSYPSYGARQRLRSS
jgi:hypothetical protein